MNTPIRFPSRSEVVQQVVVGLVEQLLGGQALETDIMDATRAISDAFHSADCQAGNGNGGMGTATVREFYAIANIDTGEFKLYREIK